MSKLDSFSTPELGDRKDRFDLIADDWAISIATFECECDKFQLPLHHGLKVQLPRLLFIILLHSFDQSFNPPVIRVQLELYNVFFCTQCTYL